VQFSYKALDQNQAVIVGVIDASDEREAARLIREKNLQPLTVTPREEEQGGLRKKLSREDITISLFELTTMLESGVSIAEALQSLHEADSHPKLRRFTNPPLSSCSVAPALATHCALRICNCLPISSSWWKRARRPASWVRLCAAV